VTVLHNDGYALVDVEDNGRGLPKDDRDRLLEPYMTTREKGTGLGLAIVRKIMEEHGGQIALLDAKHVAEGETGALDRLSFPLERTAADGDPDAAGTRTTVEVE
jgi:two-component system nitrogen regulation sensor histidine kinase NtrY